MINVAGSVLLDFNTQRDLFQPDGAMPVFQCSKYLEPLKRIFTAAHRLAVPIVSTRLYNQFVASPRGSVPRLVCNPQTPGYQKLNATLLRRRVEMPSDCGTSLPVEGFHRAQQYIFDLSNLNLFECPRLDRLLSESSVREYIIIGAPLEGTIRTAVLGLLQRRAKLALISECIGQWDPYEGDMALRQIESKNVEWLSIDQAIARMATKPPRPRLFEKRPVAASDKALNTPHTPPPSKPARPAKAERQLRN